MTIACHKKGIRENTRDCEASLTVKAKEYVTQPQLTLDSNLFFGIHYGWVGCDLLM